MITTNHRWTSLYTCTKARLLSINEEIRQARKKGESIDSLKNRRRDNDQLLSRIALERSRGNEQVLAELEAYYKVL